MDKVSYRLNKGCIWTVALASSKGRSAASSGAALSVPGLQALVPPQTATAADHLPLVPGGAMWVWITVDGPYLLI